MIYSCQFIVEEKVECPYSIAEVVVLAKYLESKKKATTKEYSVKMNKQQIVMAWQFISSALHNEVIPNAEQLPTFFEAFEKLAEYIDGQSKMTLSPFEMLQGGRN